MAVAAAAFGAAVWAAVPASAAGTGTWHPQQMPAVTSANLYGVACPSSAQCMAVGNALDATGTSQPLTLQGTDGQWTAVPAPNPGSGTGSGENAQFNGVSCLSASDCTAVGYFDHTTGGLGYQAPLAEHWDGSTWTAQPVPVPQPTQAPVRQAVFNSVSCVSPANCMAVGGYQGPHHYKLTTLAEHWDGTRWTIVPVPVPAGSDTAELDAVSCPTATRCVAAGVQIIKLGPETLFAAVWNGTGWRDEKLPLPTGSFWRVRGLSCLTPAHCTFVGSYFAGKKGPLPLVYRSSGTAWAAQSTAPLPGGTGSLNGVSCTSNTSCTAVGEDSQQPGVGVAEHWNGTSWTLQSMRIPHGSPDVILGAVSCHSATTCTAVGNYGGMNGTTFAEHE